MSAPYTHADHAHRTVIAYYRGEPLGIRTQHVQVMVSKTVCCARIVNAWDTADGLEMWQLDLLGPVYGRMSLPASRVRQCAHVDGRCTCVPFDLVPDSGAASARGTSDVCGTASAGSSSLPDGNHGENIPECTE